MLSLALGVNVAGESPLAVCVRRWVPSELSFLFVDTSASRVLDYRSAESGKAAHYLSPLIRGASWQLFTYDGRLERGQ